MKDKIISVVVLIPCFKSSIVIQNTCEEILNLFQNSIKYNDFSINFSRIVLIDDGSDISTKNSLEVLCKSEKIDLICLNKNYGQHPAIFAGVLNTTEDLIVTMDEDGEHDPNIIPLMISKLLEENLDIVYADFQSKSFNLKEFISRSAKTIVSWISGDKHIKYFSSFRLVRGDIFRTAAIYANNGAFLDIAIGWISKNIGTIKTQKRITSRKSTYNWRSLFSHFGKLFFASGIRPLIFLFNFGWIVSIISLIAITYIIYRRIFNYIPVQGWVSNTIVLMFFGGIIISALGLIARYISSIVETSSGKPFFTIKNKSNG